MTSENDEYVDRDDDAPSMWESLLTPGASAIAGFTFAVFSMLGQGTWSTALQSLFWDTGNFPGNEVGGVLTVWAVGTLLMAVVGLLLARRAVGDPASATWEGNLARAAMLVAAGGALLSFLGILGGLLRL